MIILSLAVLALCFVIYKISKQVTALTESIKDLLVIISKQSSTIKKEMTSKGLPVGENYFCTSDMPSKEVHPLMRTLKKTK